MPPFFNRRPKEPDEDKPGPTSVRIPCQCPGCGMEFDAVLEVACIASEERRRYDRESIRELLRQADLRRRERDRVYGPGIRKARAEAMAIVREICPGQHLTFRETSTGWVALTPHERKRPTLSFSSLSSALWFGIRGVPREQVAGYDSIRRVRASRGGLVSGQIQSVQALRDLAPMIRKAVEKI